MPRGSAPGEHRGGRKAGVPNKTSLSKSAEIYEERKRSGRPIAVDLMSQTMTHYWNLAAKHRVGGPEPDELKFDHYLGKCGNVAKDLAPYETPKLQTITMREETLDLTKLTDEELTQLESIRAKAAVRSGNSIGVGEAETGTDSPADREVD